MRGRHKSKPRAEKNTVPVLRRWASFDDDLVLRKQKGKTMAHVDRVQIRRQGEREVR